MHDLQSQQRFSRNVMFSREMQEVYRDPHHQRSMAMPERLLSFVMVV